MTSYENLTKQNITDPACVRELGYTMSIKLLHLCVRICYFNDCACSLLLTSVQNITQKSERCTEDVDKLGKPDVVLVNLM